MNPEYTFEGQRSDEEVVFVIKRHPWVLAKAGFVFLVVFALVIVICLIFGLSNVSWPVIFGAIVFFVLYGLYIWFIYNNYINILTNQRIIIIEQKNIFSRKIIEAELEKIQNITVEVSGPIKTMLNFGNVSLRTAGNDPTLVLVNIENPYLIQQKIIKHCKNYSQNNQSLKNIIR